MSEFRTYKFMVVPVVQEVDDEGNVVSELTPEQPIAVFGIAGLHTFADNFEADLITRMQQSTNNRREHASVSSGPAGN